MQKAQMMVAAEREQEISLAASAEIIQKPVGGFRRGPEHAIEAAGFLQCHRPGFFKMPRLHAGRQNEVHARQVSAPGAEVE